MPSTERQTHVQKVTVYTDRAMLTRSTETRLEPGLQTISLTGLPAQFAQDSLRISGQGEAEVTILDFKLRSQTVSEVPEEQVRALLEQKKELEYKRDALQAAQDIVQQKKEFLKSIGVATSENISRELNVQRPSVADFKEVMEFMGQEGAVLDANFQSLQREIEVTNDVLSSVIIQLKNFSSLTSKVRHFAEVEIDVQTAGDFTLEMSYLIHNARWNPSYDARVNAANKTVSVRYFGQVSQQTGEDWSQIEVVLSTARPHLSGNPPTIQPWYVDIYRPAPVGGYGGGGPRGGAYAQLAEEGAFDDDEMHAEEALAAAAPAPMKKMRKAQVRQATVQQSEGASAVFTTQGKSDVPGDGSTGKLLILENEFPNIFRYLTVPKIAAHVYLTAELENNTEFPLLPGKINIFLDGNFVGNAALPKLVTPEETFELNLGVDESIRVTHKLLRKKGDEKGLFTKSKVQHHAYLITLENLRNTEETITVQDQLPVSQDEKIKVEVEKISPAEHAEKDEEKLPNGALEWKIQAAPKSETKIELAFAVTYPRDLRINGL